MARGLGGAGRDGPLGGRSLIPLRLVHASPRAGAGGGAGGERVAGVNRYAAVLAQREVDAAHEAVSQAAVLKLAVARQRALGKEAVGDLLRHLRAELALLVLGSREAQDHALLGARKRHVEEAAVLAGLVVGALLLHEHTPLERRLALLGAGRAVLAEVGQLEARGRQGEQLALAVPHGEQARGRVRALRAAAPHDGHDVKLKALGGVRRHEAHGVQALAG